MTRKTAAVLTLVLSAGAALAQGAAYTVDGDGISKPLAGTTAGNAARGKALIAARTAPCLECHTIAGQGLPKGGDKGPALNGIGAALTPPQLRLSVADYAQIARGKEMPNFHKLGTDEAPKLNPQDLEDIVAYLATLKK